VHAHGVDVGAVQQVFVGGRVVGLDPLDQLILAKILLPRPSGGRRNGDRVVPDR
jgi:hypothetical protein